MKKGAQEALILGPKDAAVILRDSEDLEVIIPDQDESEDAYPASVIAAALAMALTDEALTRQILNHYEGVEVPEAIWH